jgi:16S rRNA (cytosine967-C5)-methyltransferase
VTPGARVAAAAEILDRVLAGDPAERALTNWARASRFAGSGDRAAIRDIVFDALRRRRSAAALGGAATGRGLVRGLLREAGQDPATLFDGIGHAPAPLSAAEAAHLARPIALSALEALDCPEWLAPDLRASLGASFAPVMRALRDRAPIWLRANLARARREAVAEALAADGVATQPHPTSPAALQATGNARRLRGSRAFRDGLVELQDIAPQVAMEALPLAPGMRVLDYCAGGGGKALALHSRCPGALFHAHDSDPSRLRALPARAARAGATIGLLAPGAVSASGPYDLVLCDVPCSGSGAWRRSPDAKWRTDAAGLAQAVARQDAILDAAAPLVAPGGMLAYATCSLLDAENRDRIAGFRARHPEWHLALERRFLPPEDGDGFFLAGLVRQSADTPTAPRDR